MAKKSKFTNGNFHPKNPGKYSGTYPIVFRSSWELKIMEMFDVHPYILRWASEGIAIPYYNPVLQRPAQYFPDFLIAIRKDNPEGGYYEHKMMIEIKPENQSIMEKATSKRNKLETVVNMAKWEAAKRWCDERGIEFKVMTEHDIFHTGRK